MIEVLPQEALEAPPPETKKTADGDTIPDDGKLRLDLGCGRSKRDAFKGVDIATDIPEVDYPGVDLTKPNWPFEDNSVEMIHSSHFLEHLDGDEQITFMNECCRILRPGGVLLIIVPYGNSPRAWQDPTHKRPIFVETFLYYSKPMREAMRTTNGPYARITADFEFDQANGHLALKPEWLQRTAEVQQFAAMNYFGAVTDLIMKLTKRVPDESDARSSP